MIKNDGKNIEFRIDNKIIKVPYCDYFKIDE